MIRIKLVGISQIKRISLESHSAIIYCMSNDAINVKNKTFVLDMGNHILNEFIFPLVNRYLKIITN